MKDHFATAAFRLVLGAALALGAIWPASLFAGDLRLVMFEEAGCIWCARWDAEIGPIYPKTAQAEAAPLLRLHLHDDLPEGLSLARPARFTPTFVLVSDGVEVGRIEGYPGQDFFWPLLDDLLARAETGAEG